MDDTVDMKSWYCESIELERAMTNSLQHFQNQGNCLVHEATLPDTDIPAAYKRAEKLRGKVEKTVSPCGEVITISAGVANYPDCTMHFVRLTEIADEMMYQAKKTGRNKVVTAQCGKEMVLL